MMKRSVMKVSLAPSLVMQLSSAAAVGFPSSSVELYEVRTQKGAEHDK
jgi:hypothetical protein